jgi:Protein of unknown function (DUF2867)
VKETLPAIDSRITTVEIPVASQIAGICKFANLADAYSIKLPIDTVASPELLARFIFAQPAPWIIVLMRIRDALVAGFGLKTSTRLRIVGTNSTAERVGIFKVYNTTEHEILLGEDDKHLDFRLSVLCSRPAENDGEQHLVLSTVVHCHNRLGRFYIFLIAPFHRIIVKSSLRRAARVGWPCRR